MKKLIYILAALLLTVSIALADGIQETNAVTVSLDGNPTTGYVWTGFVLGGESVLLTDPAGTYVPDDAPEGLSGVGGKTYFTLLPAAPGESIVTFTYARSWEPDFLEQRVLLANVDDDMKLTVSDVTEIGVITGTVISVDTEDCSAMLMTETHGELIVRFAPETQLPAENETITVYTNGVMTMSLPAIVNAIAWSSVPSDMARTAE